MGCDHSYLQLVSIDSYCTETGLVDSDVLYPSGKYRIRRYDDV